MPGTSTRTTEFKIRMPNDLMAEVESYAAREGVSRSQAAVRLMRLGVGREGAVLERLGRVEALLAEVAGKGAGPAASAPCGPPAASGRALDASGRLPPEGQTDIYDAMG